jgi:ABC-type Fe3+/spermidine/putrescine transport system ATPase subunit
MIRLTKEYKEAQVLQNKFVRDYLQKILNEYSTREIMESKNYLPSAIKIGNYLYTVCDMDRKQACDDQMYARISFNKLEIAVDMEHCDSRIRTSLLHEILHGIWNNYCLEEKDCEERIVSVLSNGIMHVFSDNPKLFDFIFFKGASDDKG